MVLLILAGVWAAVLLPPYLRNRSDSRPSDSIVSFRQQLSTIERATPGSRHLRGANPLQPSPSLRPVPMRMSRASVRKRRRDILFTLLGAETITFALVVAGLGTVALLVFLAVTVLTIAYVALLVQVRKSATERNAKVRYLAQGNGEPTLILRRSASQ